jgi:signal transduction histidine kinase
LARRNNPLRRRSRSTGSGGIDLTSVLLLLPALSILPMIAFAILLLHGQWESRQEESRRELQQTVRTLAVAVDREIAGTIRQLERVADAPMLSQRTLRDFHAYLRLLSSQRNDWDNLILLDRNGEQVLNAALPFEAAKSRRDDLPHATVVESGRPAVSGIYLSTTTGSPAVAVSVPVLRGAEIRWILSARLSGAHVSALLREPLLRPGALSSVVDAGGLIVARSEGLERFFGQPASPDYLALIKGSSRGVGRARTADGRDYLASWERLDNGWTVGLGVPGEVYDGPLRESLLKASLAGAALLLLGLGFALWLSRRVAQAIDDAAAVAGQLAEERLMPLKESGIAQVSRLFRALHQASSRLVNTARERNEAMAGLRREVQRRDEFLAMLAHELRNPLAPLTNVHQLLERTEALSERGHGLLAMATRQTGQLARLVDDLLDVSRLTSGRITLRLAPVSMKTLVQDAVEASRSDADASSQRLEVELPAAPLEVLADAARVRQILDNLLANAIKFGREGGCIRVTLHEDGGKAVVAVTDDGTGIDPDRLDELFKPFSQIDPGLDRAHGGLGLGLAMVRMLAAMHGGSAEADSDGLGRGATFTVRLPKGGPPAPPPSDSPPTA